MSISRMREAASRMISSNTSSAVSFLSNTQTKPVQVTTFITQHFLDTLLVIDPFRSKRTFLKYFHSWSPSFTYLPIRFFFISFSVVTIDRFPFTFCSQFCFLLPNKYSASYSFSNRFPFSISIIFSHTVLTSYTINQSSPISLSRVGKSFPFRGVMKNSR